MTISDPVPPRYRKGVGALVFNSDGRVLVARRLGTTDAWQLPQGGLRSGEDPRIAARRELLEEIGTDRVEIIAECSEWLRYDLPEALCGKVWKGRYQGQEQRWFAFRFTGEDADIDVAADSHPEFDAWQWVDIEQLPALAVDFKRALYEQLVEQFRQLVEQCGGASRDDRPLNGGASCVAT
jgi:putative (di)nucleoside polyphosphate hydrolase